MAAVETPPAELSAGHLRGCARAIPPLPVGKIISPGRFVFSADVPGGGTRCSGRSQTGLREDRLDCCYVQIGTGWRSMILRVPNGRRLQARGAEEQGSCQRCRELHRYASNDVQRQTPSKIVHRGRMGATCAILVVHSSGMMHTTNRRPEQIYRERVHFLCVVALAVSCLP